MAGLALRARPGTRLTSGNSYTTWAAMRAVELGCAKHGISLADCTVAVVGATGAIGHAMSLLCAERAAELILIGNPRVAEASIGRLQAVAEDCNGASHLSPRRTQVPTGTRERSRRRPLRSAGPI